VKNVGKIFIVLAVLLTGAPSVGGRRAEATRSRQAEPQTAQPPVRFGVEVNYVEVDVTVMDRNGNFVSDLEPGDFEILEDGEPQSVENFTVIDIEVERPTPVVFKEQVEPDVRSNLQVSEGRVYILVLDSLHTTAQRTHRVKMAASQFIEERFGANDIAAVVHTDGRRDASQEFTGSPRLLLNAIDKFMGKKLRSKTLSMLDQSIYAFDAEEELYDPQEEERAQRARDALEMLEKLAQGLEDIHGRRKAIIYFGEGIDYNTYDVFEGSNASSILDSTDRAIVESARANVSIYTVDPRGLSQVGENSAAIGGVPTDFADQIGRPSIHSALQDEFILSQDSLRTLSEETGGFAILNQNDYAPGLTRIQKENSHYYLLGYYPTNDERNGKFRKIEVRVNRPDVEVKYRRGYLAPGKRDKRKELEEIDTPDGVSPVLAKMVQSPLPLPELPMRAVASPFRIDKKKAIVPLVVEMSIERFKFTEKDGKFHDEIEFSAIALDKKGKFSGGVKRDFQLALRPQTHMLMSQAGFRVMAALELPSGQYQLRIVASEKGAGVGGSLFYDVDIPEYEKADLVMTPLVVTSAIENRVPVIAAEEDREKAILLPATRRNFTRSDQLVVLTEVYPRFRGSKAPTVDISIAIKATDDRIVFQASEERGGEELTRQGEGIIFRKGIPLSEIAPGDYLLEVTARDRSSQKEEIHQVLIEVF
jgi:VWFA-related protein